MVSSLALPCARNGESVFRQPRDGSGQQASNGLPAGPGRDLTASTCSKCHSLANITSLHQDRDAWSATVSKMVSFGAAGSDEDFAQIVDYLSKNFGKDSLPAAIGKPHPGAEHTAKASLRDHTRRRHSSSSDAASEACPGRRRRVEPVQQRSASLCGEDPHHHQR